MLLGEVDLLPLLLRRRRGGSQEVVEVPQEVMEEMAEEFHPEA